MLPGEVRCGPLVEADISIDVIEVVTEEDIWVHHGVQVRF
jgi:hypothetical protein